MIKIQWHPTQKKIREFGLTFWVGFALVGALAYGRAHPMMARWIWGTSSVMGLWALVFPQWAKPFYWTWMGVGFAMGMVMSRLILTVVFFFVFTPVALIFRWLGRDSLNLKKPRGANSYWKDHPKISDKTYYEHLF